MASKINHLSATVPTYCMSNICLPETQACEYVVAPVKTSSKIMGLTIYLAKFSLPGALTSVIIYEMSWI